MVTVECFLEIKERELYTHTYTSVVTCLQASSLSKSKHNQNESIESEISGFFFSCVFLPPPHFLRVRFLSLTLTFFISFALVLTIYPCHQVNAHICMRIQKNRRKKKHLYESHTLVCLNGLFSFCHFSMYLFV